LKLSKKQQIFSLNVAQLITWIYEQPGLSITLGEAYRPEFVAAKYQAEGKGVIGSHHTNRLAIDLNLFKDGIYQTTTEAHREIGKYWKTLDPACVWGGAL